MLSALKGLFAELTGSSRPAERFADNDYRVAAAALLVHAATIDGGISRAEQDKLGAVLQHRFDLDEAAAAELIEEATAAEHEAVDLYQFTSRINRSLDTEGRRRIVEMMWEIIYADGRVSEFEDNLVWRVADLLNVSSRDRLELRRQAAAGSGAKRRE
jgi:uncharacterized tellurite resistance protein B-like protein